MDVQVLLFNVLTSSKPKSFSLSVCKSNINMFAGFSAVFGARTTLAKDHN